MLTPRKYADSPGPSQFESALYLAYGGPQARVSSPRTGCSILMTSALRGCQYIIPHHRRLGVKLTQDHPKFEYSKAKTVQAPSSAHATCEVVGSEDSRRPERGSCRAPGRLRGVIPRRQRSTSAAESPLELADWKYDKLRGHCMSLGSGPREMWPSSISHEQMSSLMLGRELPRSTETPAGAFSAGAGFGIQLP